MCEDYDHVFEEEISKDAIVVSICGKPVSEAGKGIDEEAIAASAKNKVQVTHNSNFK